MCNNRSLFLSFRRLSRPIQVRGVGQCEVEWEGEIGVSVLVNGVVQRRVFKDVLYAPFLHCSLISVGTLQRNGCTLSVSDDTPSVWSFARKGAVGLQGVTLDGLVFVLLADDPYPVSDTQPTVSKVTATPSQAPPQQAHVDMCGPRTTTSDQSKTYLLGIADGASSASHACTVRSKGESAVRPASVSYDSDTLPALISDSDASDEDEGETEKKRKEEKKETESQSSCFASCAEELPSQLPCSRSFSDILVHFHPLSSPTHSAPTSGVHSEPPPPDSESSGGVREVLKALVPSSLPPDPRTSLEGEPDCGTPSHSLPPDPVLPRNITDAGGGPDNKQVAD